MSEKVYPDWVQKQKTTGTTVKKVGSNYYLYKHSSKRVHGKKNLPVDTYIGKITPEGIKKSGSKKVAVNDAEVIVKEYGFSKSVEALCPAGWKEPLGKNWQETLDFIIVRESPESYVQQVRKVPEQLDPHIQLGAQKAALQRRMKKEYGVDFKELKQLSSIYMVSVSGKKLVSKISEEQKKLLERLELKLEVD